MDIQLFIDTILEFFSKEPFIFEIKKAKDLFIADRGIVVDSDPEYDRYMTCFTNWFLFDYQVTDATYKPIDYYSKINEAALKENEKALIASLLQPNHSFFQIIKIMEKEIRVLDLFTKEKIIITEESINQFLHKDSIFEGWILTYQDKFYLLNGYFFHPQEVNKYITMAIKRSIKNKNGSDKQDIIIKACRARLKTDLYIKLGLKNIYKQELNL